LKVVAQSNRLTAHYEKLERDKATVLLCKTKMTGAMTLTAAADILIQIEAFFDRNREYLRYSENQSFICNYPAST
jgi:hypothetical protein